MPAPTRDSAFSAVHAMAEALAVAGVNAVADGRCAFNPLAIARRAVVRLSGWPATPAVRAASGARFPAQADGDGLLVELPLGALESVALEPHSDPVAGCHWEVSASVLDNGRTRIELDRAGRIQRWCVDGAFAPLLSPIGPSWDSPTIAVLERGPVRARVRVGHGAAWLDYVLHAHGDEVRIASSGVDHLTVALRHAARVVGGGIGPGAPVASAGADDRRWCVLTRLDGTVLAIAICDDRMQIGGDATAMTLSPAPGVELALRLPARRDPSPSVAALALAAAIAVDLPSVPVLRLIDAEALAPLAIGRAADLGLVLTLIECANAVGRAHVYPTGGVRAAWRVDAAGAKLADLPLTAEGDGIELDHGPSETLLVRWR